MALGHGRPVNSVQRFFVPTPLQHDLLADLTSTVVQPPFYVPNPDGGDVGWCGPCLRNRPILPQQTNRGVYNQWRSGGDDPAVWQQKHYRNLAGLTPPVAAQAQTKQWHHDNDDSSVRWGWFNRNNSGLLAAVQGNPSRAKQRQYDNDDSSAWWRRTNRNAVIGATVDITATLAAIEASDLANFNGSTPNIARASFYVPRPAQDQLWAFKYQPTLLQTIEYTLYQRGNQYFNYTDTPSIWSGRPAARPSALNLKLYQYGNQFFKYFDEPAIWSSRPLSSSKVIPLDSVLYQRGNQYFNYTDNPSIWSGAPVDAPQALTLGLALYQYGNQFFNYNDNPALWVGRPLSAKSIRTSLAGFNVTEPPDIAAFIGSVNISGTLAVTELADIAAFAGSPFNSASFALSELTDIALFNGTVTGLAGTLAAIEASDIADFSGSVISVQVTGDLIVTESGDVASFSGVGPDSSDFGSWKFGRRFDRSLTKRFPWRH